MFIVNGGGHNNTRMTADQVIEKFGLKIKPDNFGHVEFDYTTSVKTKDRFGTVRQPNLLSLSPVVRGTYKSEVYNVRFFVSESFGENGRPIYNPKRLRMIPDEESLSYERAKEKIVARILMKQCEQSPFRTDADRSPIYRVRSRAVESSQNVTREGQMAQLIISILELGENEIRRKAKGVNVKGQRIANAHIKSLGQLQDELIIMARRHGQLFIDAWKDSSTDVRGLATDCLDYDIIVQENSGRERVFKWGSDGTTILKAPKGRDPIDVLALHIIENYETLIPLIDKKLTEVNLEGMISGVKSIKEEAADPVMDLVKKSVELGNLTLNFADNKVYFLKDGAPKGDPIEVPNTKQWMEGVVEYANSHPSRLKKLENAAEL